MVDNPYWAVAEWLKGEAVKIREIEKKAYSALYDNGDESLYREFMRQKALNLSCLAEEAQALVDRLPGDAREIVSERIERFSFSASQSLEIGSIFFMSALLYPEDYRDGDMNDLENFAAMVRDMTTD